MSLLDEWKLMGKVTAVPFVMDCRALAWKMRAKELFRPLEIGPDSLEELFPMYSVR
jgi:hypothetical protein